MRRSFLPRDRGLLPGHVRFAGLVQDAGAEAVWFDVPEPLADAGARPDRWLAPVVPAARIVAAIDACRARPRPSA